MIYSVFDAKWKKEKKTHTLISINSSEPSDAYLSWNHSTSKKYERSIIKIVKNDSSDLFQTGEYFVTMRQPLFSPSIRIDSNF